jgi:5-methylcytosine-specific restriction endonuclease McrA
MPSSPNYKRDYAHEDAIRDKKPGEVHKRVLRNQARQQALHKGLVHKGDKKQVDHITPLSKGGSNTTRNLRVVAAHINESYPRGHHGELLRQNAALRRHHNG